MCSRMGFCPPRLDGRGGYFSWMVGDSFYTRGYSVGLQINRGPEDATVTTSMVEISCCGPSLVIESYPVLRGRHCDFIWNRDGHRRIVPAEILTCALELKDAYRTLEKHRRISCIPLGIGVILWEQAREFMRLGDSEVLLKPGPTI